MQNDSGVDLPAPRTPPPSHGPQPPTTSPGARPSAPALPPPPALACSAGPMAESTDVLLAKLLGNASSRASTTPRLQRGGAGHTHERRHTGAAGGWIDGLPRHGAVLARVHQAASGAVTKTVSHTSLLFVLLCSPLSFMHQVGGDGCKRLACPGAHAAAAALGVGWGGDAAGSRSVVTLCSMRRSTHARTCPAG